jgi:hypothetical protein
VEEGVIIAPTEAEYRRWEQSILTLRRTAQALTERTPITETTPEDYTPEPSQSIRICGSNWEVYYRGERGSYPVKDYVALATVAKVVARPNHFFSILDLVDGERRTLLERPESRDEVLDSQALTELRRKWEELQRDMADQDDPIVKSENQAEFAELTAQLKKTVGPGDRRRKLGRTATDRAWDTLTKNLRRLWPRLRNSGMPLLAAHMESTIHIDQLNIAYHPPAGTPPWTTKP